MKIIVATYLPIYISSQIAMYIYLLNTRQQTLPPKLTRLRRQNNLLVHSVYGAYIRVLAVAPVKESTYIVRFLLMHTEV